MTTATPLMRQPLFLRLWAGTTASGLATWGLVFLLSLATSEGLLGARMLGVILALRSLGFLAGVIFGGVLADQFGPRRVIFYAGVLACIGSGLVAIGMAGIDLVAALWVGVIMAGPGSEPAAPLTKPWFPRWSARISAKAPMPARACH